MERRSILPERGSRIPVLCGPRWSWRFSWCGGVLRLEGEPHRADPSAIHSQHLELAAGHGDFVSHSWQPAQPAEDEPADSGVLRFVQLEPERLVHLRDG